MMTETIPQTDELLDRTVASVMRHGVVSIAEDASLPSVANAMRDHHVHAILVEQRSTGRPLGWAKADALLSWLNMRSPWAHAHQAMTEKVTTIAPTATVREAIEALQRPGTSRLLVRGEGASAGEGVLTHLDVIELLTGR
jgi:CBS domain-containing protein